MTSVHGPCSLDVAAQVDPILRRAIYWGPTAGAADSRISRIVANTLSVSVGAAFTEIGRFTANGLDLGFTGLLFGQTIGSPDSSLHRGLSGGVECDDAGGLLSYGAFMARYFGSFQQYSDAAGASVLYKSQDAFAGATVNLNGANSVFAAGLGLWTVTVSNFAALAGATVTVTVNGGAPQVFTEGVSWTAATSNDATAASLRAALLAANTQLSSVTANVVGIVGQVSTYTLTVASSDAVNLAVVHAGTDGTARVTGGSVTLEINGSACLTVLGNKSITTGPSSPIVMGSSLVYSPASTNTISVGYYNWNELGFGSAIQIGWASGAYSGTADVGIVRAGAAALLRVTDGSSGIGAVSAGVYIQARSTTPQTLNVTDSGFVFTNEGASALIVFNLPTAAAGMVYEFIVQDTDGIKVVASGGDTIRIGGAVSAAAGNIQATAIGSVVRLVCINATEWIAAPGVGGTWTVT